MNVYIYILYIYVYISANSFKKYNLLIINKLQK